jgi:hypothetical protein
MKKLLLAMLLAPAVAFAQQGTSKPPSGNTGVQGEDTGTGKDQAQVERSKKKAKSTAQKQKSDHAQKGDERWDGMQQGTARVGPGSKHAVSGDQATQNAANVKKDQKGASTDNMATPGGSAGSGMSGNSGSEGNGSQTGTGTGTTGGSAGGGSGR